MNTFDWPAFLEIPGFHDGWEEAGCTDRDLADLQQTLREDPTGWPVVPKAGGWRKARFVPASWGTGKSGGLRVYYSPVPELGLIILGVAFRKADKSDLSAAAKRVIGTVLSGILDDLRGGK